MGQYPWAFGPAGFEWMTGRAGQLWNEKQPQGRKKKRKWESKGAVAWVGRDRDLLVLDGDTL